MRVSLCVSVSLYRADRAEGATRLAYKPIKVESHTTSLTSGLFCAPTCWRCERGGRYVSQNRSSQPQPTMSKRPCDVQLHGWVWLLCARGNWERALVLCQPCERSTHCRHTMGDSDSLLSDCCLFLKDHLYFARIAHSAGLFILCCWWCLPVRPLSC